ncbi:MULTISPECIES: YCF48-related protein [unclassified Duganella]|uniref:WD40/YVTN/BNR-like repeat-containing protein n=1 Tax=unclassified Duganella TaxID=2636909 RepID=UPI001E63957F|nr:MULTISPECIES: YCF48-related protein [unclassified Duganella]
MNYLFTVPRRAAALLLAAFALCGGAARAEPDVLERPAIPSVKAAGSVLLAITTAGTGRRLVAAGERGIILWSDDRGLGWHQASVPVSVSLTALRFINGQDGWALGHSGILLRTRDGGKNWSKQLDGKQAAALMLAAVKADSRSGRQALADAERLVAEGANKPWLDLHFFDARHGLLVGAFGLLFATDDGGQSWQAAPGRIDNPKAKHLYAVAGHGDACLIAGEQGALYYSDNRGQSFSAADAGYQGSYFGGLALSPRALLAFGMRGNVRWSDDAGASWHRSDLGTTASISAGLRLRDGALLLADDTGQLYRSTDGGKRFDHIAPPQPSPFTAIAQADDGSLLLAGVRGITRIALNPAKVQP